MDCLKCWFSELQLGPGKLKSLKERAWESILTKFPQWFWSARFVNFCFRSLLVFQKILINFNLWESAFVYRSLRIWEVGKKGKPEKLETENWASPNKMDLCRGNRFVAQSYLCKSSGTHLIKLDAAWLEIYPEIYGRIWKNEVEKVSSSGSQRCPPKVFPSTPTSWLLAPKPSDSGF